MGGKHVVGAAKLPSKGGRSGWLDVERRRGSIFSGKECNNEIMSRRIKPIDAAARCSNFAGLWRARAPLKAQIFAWRLLRDRLPTKGNLVKRNTLGELDQSCCCCSIKDESAAHFFMRCREIEKLWDAVVDWIGANWVQPNEVHLHWLGFSNLLGKGTFERRLIGLWICVAWVLWKWRNTVIFKEK